jgi:hypothetical protein
MVAYAQAQLQQHISTAITFNAPKTQTTDTILHIIMKLTTYLAASTATLASARPQYDAAPSNPHEWMAAGPNDCTSPFHPLPVSH